MPQDRSDRDQQARSPADQGSLTLRPRVTADDAAIVELYRRQEADSAPLTIERYRAEHDERDADRPGEVWIALERDQVVGMGDFFPAWWTGHLGIYAAEIRVDGSHRRQGIGSRLFNLLRSRLAELGATRLVAWVRDDAVHGRCFAVSHGFQETGEVLEEYRLYVPEATTEAYAGLEERLRCDGLRFVSLAELGREDEPFLRALHGLGADVDDAHSDAEQLRASFESWQRKALHAPGLSPDTHWVALDGERPVGMTYLKRLSEDAAENDYTVVAPTHRGRGIAPALKLQAIAWARRNGVRWFYTSSEIGNTPMIAVNRRLGYRPGVRRRELVRELRR